MSGLTEDIGPNGLRIQWREESPPAGSSILLRIAVPGMGVITAFAAVVWPGAKAFGCRLTNAPEEWFRFCAGELRAAVNGAAR